jgi:hypothetical protein
MMRSNGTNGTIPRGLSFLEPRCHLVVTLGLAKICLFPYQFDLFRGSNKLIATTKHDQF